MEGRKQFTFYRSYYEAVLMLPDTKRLGVWEALIAYALDHKMPQNLDPMQKMAFMLIKPTLDSGWDKAKAGQKGGSKPKANRKQNESKKKQSKSKPKADKEKDKDMDMDKEYPYPSGISLDANSVGTDKEIEDDDVWETDENGNWIWPDEEEGDA
jgi:hypothetical protein